MPTTVVNRRDDRRFDRWCAGALIVSAALGLIESTGAFVRLPAGEFLIPYAWVSRLAEGIVLVVVARSFASGRRRDASAAFLLGFSALALLDAASGLRYLTEGGATVRSADFAMSFSASVIEVCVGVRALTLTLGRSQRRVPMSRVVTAIVSVAVFAGFAAMYGDYLIMFDLLAFAAIAAIPVVALRRAEAAVPVLWGLIASLLLGLARRLLDEYFISRNVRFGPEISLAAVPAIVFLFAFVSVTRRRIANMAASIPSFAWQPSASREG